jgi:8-oxo-dGTP diphosphatase
MRFIYGTKNSGKLEHMKHILRDMHMDIIELDKSVTEPEETGAGMLENAKIKAVHYYKQIKQPVFSCDSGLYFEGVEEEDQPGKYIRRVKGKTLTDDEMITHYGKLADKYGGELTARYHNAICLVLSEEQVISYDGKALNSAPFKLISKPHNKRLEGFPLDALSVEPESNQYYYDLQDFISDDDGLDWGFQTFFKRVLTPEVKLKFKGFDEIIIDLMPYHAPDTVRNFVTLIQSGYYNNKSLCRSVPSRLIQSGDSHLIPEKWTDDTPGYILNGEFNRPEFHNKLTFDRGTIGMAMAAYHETDYATAGSFFIMTRDESKLDRLVPAFGRVRQGLETVDVLNQLPTHTEYGYDAPVETVAIEYMTVDKKGVIYKEPEKVSFNKINPRD